MNKREERRLERLRAEYKAKEEMKERAKEAGASRVVKTLEVSLKTLSIELRRRG